MVMIATPKNIGLPTCLLAVSTVWRRSSVVSGRRRWCWRIPSWRTTFSTMTTAPSMIRPKSIAPRLIKFPETPNFNMPVTANRNESGMAAVTMSAARQLPSNTSKTAMTKIVLSNKLFRTVWIVLLIRIERSYCGRICTLSGSFSWISDRRALTRSAISRLFSPASIMVVPMTVSWPSIVAAPVRNRDP